MLEIKNVCKTFGKKKVLDNVSLTLENSSICGLVGYNGAGKTTLMKIIASVYTADSGKTLLDGRDTAADHAVRRKMYYVADELWFAGGQTLNKAAEYCARLYDNFSRETFDRITGIMGLDCNGRLASFSKGMRRQAAIALAFSSRPALMLIDESFDGLDPQKRDLVKKLLMEYIAETDGTVLVSSHNVRELSGLCDRIALMNNEKIQLDLTAEEITRGKYKLRLVFEGDCSDEELLSCGITGLIRDGRFIGGFSSDIENTEQKLAALHPLVFEKFPMTLEEVLLNEMGGNDYDFKDLF